VLSRRTKQHRTMCDPHDVTLPDAQLAPWPMADGRWRDPLRRMCRQATEWQVRGQAALSAEQYCAMAKFGIQLPTSRDLSLATSSSTWPAWRRQRKSPGSTRCGHGPLFPIAALGGPNEPMLEAYTLLGRWPPAPTGCSSDLVTGVTYRNPGILAKIVTTLDIISRAGPSLASGSLVRRRASGLGIEYPSDGVRLDMLEEAVQVCRAMFTAMT